MASVSALKGVPVLLIGTTTNYSFIYKGTTGDSNKKCPRPKYSIWTPQPGAGFYQLGSYAVSGYSQPTTAVYTISQQNEDPNNPLLIEPQGFTRIWTDPNPDVMFGDCQPDYTVSLWAVIPPPNYVALGMVATGIPFQGDGQYPPEPNPSTVVCLRSDYAVPASIGSQLYSGNGFLGWNGSGYSPATLWQVNSSLILYAQANEDPPSGTWFIPNNLPKKSPSENSE